MAIYPNSVDERFENQFLDHRITEVESQRWKLYFDGAANKKRYGVGVLLVATNNITKYKTCIIRLEAVVEFGIVEMEVYRYSIMIISQVLRRRKTKDKELLPYNKYLENCKLIEGCQFPLPTKNEEPIYKCTCYLGFDPSYTK